MSGKPAWPPAAPCRPVSTCLCRRNLSLANSQRQVPGFTNKNRAHSISALPWATTRAGLCTRDLPARATQTQTLSFLGIFFSPWPSQPIFWIPCQTPAAGRGGFGLTAYPLSKPAWGDVGLRRRLDWEEYPRPRCASPTAPRRCTTTGAWAEAGDPDAKRGAASRPCM